MEGYQGLWNFLLEQRQRQDEQQQKQDEKHKEILAIIVEEKAVSATFSKANMPFAKPLLQAMGLSWRAAVDSTTTEHSDFCFSWERGEGT